MNIHFRPLARADFPLLVEWFRAPHVAEWWGEEADLGFLEARYGPRVDGREPVEMFIVELDGRAGGLVQRYRLTDFAEWLEYEGLLPNIQAAAGIDYLLGNPADIGHGIGSQVIRELAGLTFLDYPDVEAIVADPDQANVASWRALEKAGFERIWAGQLASQDQPAYVYCLARAGHRTATNPH